MDTKKLAPALAGGALSALLYFASFALGLGFVFLFIPTLPLFWIALSRHDSSALHASLIATLLLLVLSGPGSSLIYFFIIAAPSLYLAHDGLKFGRYGKDVIWFPLTVTFTKFAALTSFLLLAFTLYYAGDDGGLPRLVAERLSAAFEMVFAEMPQQESLLLSSMAQDMAFLVFAVTGWMWILSIYMHGWIINRELIRRKKHIRPDFRISILPPQNWLITLLLISAIASIIGGESIAFWGKASLVMLLLPHFLLGLALIHERTKPMPNQSIFLFLIYFLMMLLLWPVLFVAGYGLYYHLRLLNKYLSAGGTSSKN